MKKLLGKFKDILSTNNYKLTKQRKDILKVFIKNRHKHYNAEELYMEVKKINPEVGLATIYRTLELFCKLGILNQLDFNSTYKRYELNIKDEHHHHLICVKCGHITEFNDRMLESFEEKIETEHKFDIINHRIKFYGLCHKCSQRKNKN